MADPRINLLTRLQLRTEDDDEAAAAAPTALQHATGMVEVPAEPLPPPAPADDYTQPPPSPPLAQGKHTVGSSSNIECMPAETVGDADK